MGYSTSAKEGYGIFLSSEDIEKIKLYLKDNDPEYTKIGEAWWYYLEEYKFKSIDGFILHSDNVDYRMHFSVEDSWGCYVGVPLWKSMTKLLQGALKAKITVPDNVNQKWKKIYAFLKTCGVKRRKPTFFSYVVTG